MGTSYGPQVVQANEELALELSLDLTLTQHPRDEEPELRKVCVHFEVNSLRVWYYHISSNSRTLVILLQVAPLLVMNLKPSVKVVIRLKTPPFSHGLQFLALDITIGCMARFADCFLIARQTT
jgi:hypothetical protein